MIAQKFFSDPPMYSAIKIDGVPLYKSARKGEDVEREPRFIRVMSWDVTRFALPQFDFRLRCTKGTYVRTLAEDIGEALGCGAHLVMLRRTGVGALTLEHAVTLDALTAADEPARDAWLQPVDALLSTFPAVTLNADAARRFAHGQRLPLNELVLDRAACEAADRVRAVVDDPYIQDLAHAVTGELRGKVGIAPRLFLKKLVAEVLDRVDQFADFDPRRHYAPTLAEDEMTPAERAGVGARSVDDIELKL